MVIPQTPVKKGSKRKREWRGRGGDGLHNLSNHTWAPSYFNPALGPGNVGLELVGPGNVGPGTDREPFLVCYAI